MRRIGYRAGIQTPGLSWLISAASSTSKTPYVSFPFYKEEESASLPSHQNRVAESQEWNQAAGATWWQHA